MKERVDGGPTLSVYICTCDLGGAPTKKEPED